MKNYSFSAKANKRPNFSMLNRMVITVIAWFTLAIFTPSFAATINVNAFPGQAGCDILDAIVSANTDSASGGCIAGSGADEILLSGSHQLAFAFDNPGSAPSIGDAALPDISSNITITGANNTEIRRSTTNPSNRFRLINITSGDLTLNNITIQGGDTNIPDTSDDNINRGGGIYIISGSLMVNNSSIVNNSGGSFGGGVYSVIASKVHFVNSTIAGNIANSGAAFNLGNVEEAILIEETSIENNASRSNVGTIGDAFISDMVVRRSAIINNKGTGLNIFRGSLAMSDSTVSGNAATPNDSPFLAVLAGIQLSPNEASSMSILNSTIVNNPPQNDQVGQAIRVHGLRIIPPDSTTLQSLSVILRNNIISANGAAGANQILQGTEIQVFDNGGNFDANNISFEFTNNIIGYFGVSTNTALNNVATVSPTLNQILTSDSVNPTPITSIINSLGDYGGPTMSHTLPSNSPAIDNGTAGYFVLTGSIPLYLPGCRGEVVSLSLLPFREDQRKLSRPVGEFCDIGSTEFRASDDESCFVTKAANGKVVVFCL